MQNTEETSEAPQAAEDAGSVVPAGVGQKEVVIVGDNLGPFTEAELAQVASLVDEDGVAETTLRGHRVLIVGGLGHSHHLAMAALARLADAGALIVASDDRIVAPELDLAALVHKIREPEPVIVAEYYDEKRGKGKRRRPWESPYGNHGGNFKQQQKRQQNIKAMTRRRGGR
jgi:hypothetical protein